MHRIMKLTGATGLALAAMSVVAVAAVQTGTYSGLTSTEEPISIEVAKNPDGGGKVVDKVTVDQRGTGDGCEKLKINKNAKIEQGKFTAKLPSQFGPAVITVKGEFVEAGLISGKTKEVVCDGAERTYNAYQY